MAVQAHDVPEVGVILVDTTTNQPLPLSVLAFTDADEAERWLLWLDGDVRLIPSAEWHELIDRWRDAPERLP